MTFLAMTFLALSSSARPLADRGFQQATSGPADPQRSELAQALRQCRAGFVGIAVASAMVNLLTLSGSIYMLQVYDRVIPSHSTATLVGLTILLLGLYAAYGLFDVLRSQLLKRVAARFERLVRDRVFALCLLQPLRFEPGALASDPIRDLDQVRGFLSGTGPLAFFDLPWLPLFLGIIFLLHPLLGLLALAGAAGIVLLTWTAEHRGRRAGRALVQAQAQRRGLADAGRRNAEIVRALGMQQRVLGRWLALSQALTEVEDHAAGSVAILTTTARVGRLFLQSAMLGLGAFLVIKGEASSGVIIAASITTARALAPVEIAIANWKSFVQARLSHARLDALLAAHPAVPPALGLPRPGERLDVEQLCVAAPGCRQPLVQNLSFALEAGAGLGVVGPSASGKSTLARALVGVWVPLRGAVRLDGSALDQWDADELGPAIGYLPQDVELFDGTIAETICRFTPDASPESIIEAARIAGVHDMISRLPEGYGTLIGEGGCALSAGQRQRLALARALYGNPFLVVLDEPNSNLDSEGEEALTSAIRAVRERGGIVIVVAHRPSALAALDQILVMANGQQVAFGRRDEVMRQTLRPRPVAPPSFPGGSPVNLSALAAKGGR